MLQRLQRVIKIDDLPNWKDVRDVMPKSNTDKAAKHWKERVNTYLAEQFDYICKEITL